MCIETILLITLILLGVIILRRAVRARLRKRIDELTKWGDSLKPLREEGSAFSDEILIPISMEFSNDLTETQLFENEAELRNNMNEVQKEFIIRGLG